MKRWIKEPFSGLSHAAGAILALIGMIGLLCFGHGVPSRVVGFAVYGISLIALFTISALYHSLNVKPRLCEWLQRLDHTAIYLLIAGTYTPVCLVTLRGAYGWSLLGIVYALATIGIVLSLGWKNAPDWLRVSLYLIMGWLAIAAFGPLVHGFGWVAMAWLIAGGVIYSVGTVVYATDWPHLSPRFSAHDLWHIFVLAGSACHFFVVFRFIALA